MKALSLFFTLIIGTIGLCQAQPSEYSFKESYPVSAPLQMAITTSDGDIEVIPTTANEVQVFYIVKKGGKLKSIDKQTLEQDFHSDPYWIKEFIMNGPGSLEVETSGGNSRVSINHSISSFISM